MIYVNKTQLFRFIMHHLENGTNAKSVDDLKQILADNSEMLNRFIVETVSLDNIEKWVQKKCEMMNIPCRLNRHKNKLSQWKV